MNEDGKEKSLPKFEDHNLNPVFSKFPIEEERAILLRYIGAICIPVVGILFFFLGRISIRKKHDKHPDDN